MRRQIFYFDSMSLVEMTQWWRGRVILFGDAAVQGDHAAAFGGYEAIMRPYVRLNQDFARQVVKSFTVRTRGRLRTRTTMMRALQLQRAANYVELKNYG